LVFETSHNTVGRLVYALEQRVTFFSNIEVSAWTTVKNTVNNTLVADELLESVDQDVAITGKHFSSTARLQCIWLEISPVTWLDSNTSTSTVKDQTIASLPADTQNSNSTVCHLPDDLYRRAFTRL